ncbi:MAG: hypothetical protein KGI71_04975 [Patescibacteria group bacterium]|nr:hypothetical protein [Patescibacteria group bacterium]
MKLTFDTTRGLFVVEVNGKLTIVDPEGRSLTLADERGKFIARKIVELVTLLAATTLSEEEE